MDQISFDDLIREHELSKLPGRIAFIDECGNFGFDFDSEGVSKYYILCAVIVKNSELSQLHNAVLKVKENNGFKDTEIKSSAIGNNYKRRSKIFHHISFCPFSMNMLIKKFVLIICIVV